VVLYHESLFFFAPRGRRGNKLILKQVVMSSSRSFQVPVSGEYSCT
jgi:hypothetical protein